MDTYTRFEGMFPSSSLKFGLTPFHQRAWELSLADHGWRPNGQIELWADDLLVRAASWRNPDNLFLSFKFSQLLWLFRQGYADMAGRKPKESRVQRATWVGFLDRRLSEAEMDACDAWEPTAGEIWERVHALIESGYRVTLSYSQAFKVATATIMDDDKTRKSGGYGLASSDVDGATALKTAVYKHFEVLAGTWDSLLDEPLKPGRRG